MPDFSETQRFRQKWLWTLLVAMVFGSTYYSYISEGFSSALLVLSISVPVVLLVYAARLETRIENGKLCYRFFPFHLKEREVGLEDSEASVEEYSPLKEFGGWGLRWRPGKFAFSTSGRQAIRIERSGSRDLVIGTQKPEEAEKSLE
ncbi:MAG: hypothetical protein ACLFRK_02495 [Candidatus Nanohaloarchaea archaeon]